MLNIPLYLANNDDIMHGFMQISARRGSLHVGR